MLGHLGVLVVSGSWFVSSGCAQNTPSWTQLSLSTCRVDAFLEERPRSDGRGVVIAVLDTGVDPSIPGLTHTPDGEVKVIDVQDFTGQGDIELHRVNRDEESGNIINYDEEGVPIQYGTPDLPADEGGEERRFWFGFFDEHKFINSAVSDLNDNGTTDDKFPVLVTALEGDGDDEAICFVDTDLDRDFTDEKRLHNYKLRYDTFTLYREEPEEQIAPLAFAINIFLRQSKVVVVYDDGAHGTHVAGIAAGYRINNQEGFHGVAPGAKVMGLKIGQNAIGGVSVTGSIKNAVEYAGRYSREHGVPVVCNLSYGVESVIEGKSDIDQWLNKYLRKNPNLIFCTSAGNEGPGLSTVGTPAASTEAISVAALLAADSARDVMGFTMDAPVVTVFSSRGGELDKPDVATPGWATSTVPRWVKRGDYWAGTSMASPYAAGLCALLISDAMARRPGASVRAWDVRRALQLGSDPVAGATQLGMGPGVPDVLKSADMLNTVLERSADDPVIGYEISTPCPHGADGEARSAYWRSTWFPARERHTFTIKPVFAPGTDAMAKTSFTRKYTLRSTAPWIKVAQETTYLRSEQSARVYVEYDAGQLAEPGLYTGAVEAVSDGLVAFSLWNTIVVPHQVDPGHGDVLRFQDQVVHGWDVERYFVATPPGVSAMHLELSAPEARDSKASFERVYGPTGDRHRRRANTLDTFEGRRVVTWTFDDELVPGVWEIPIVADRPDERWPFDLEVRFFGLHAEPEVVSEWSGSPPKGELTVTNMFRQMLPATGDGMLEGYRMTKEDKFEGLDDTLTYSATLGPAFDRLRLELEMTREAYATTTDIGVAVEVDGKEVYSSGFSNRIHEATVRAPGGGDETKAKVIIRGGFAVADDKRKTPITVRIDRLLAEPIPIEVKQGDSSRIDFVPAVPIRLDFMLKTKPAAIEEDLAPVGYLRFEERSSHVTALRVPIEIRD